MRHLKHSVMSVTKTFIMKVGHAVFVKEIFVPSVLMTEEGLGNVKIVKRSIMSCIKPKDTLMALNKEAQEHCYQLNKRK